MERDLRDALLFGIPAVLIISTILFGLLEGF